MTQKIRKKLPHWFYPAIVFALMVLAVYFPLVQGKIPFPAYVVNFFPAWTGVTATTAEYPVANIGDLVTQFYPYRSFAADSVRHGTLPLWNPYLLSGVTFVGNCLSAMFYPPNFIYYLFPLPAAWAIALAFRLFLGAMFMWLFLKSIGTTPAGSILGAVIFSCCGFMTIWQGQTMADASIWLPLIFYSIHRLHLDMSGRSAALIAFSYAMPVLAGMPETALYVTIAGTAWALLLWVFPTGKVRRPFDLRFLFSYTGSGILAMGLAAIQIIPTVEWLRELGHVLASTWPPHRLFQALAFVSRDILRNPNSAGIDIPEAAAYIGMTSLLLVPLALFHRQRKYVAFFGAMILISVGVVYGFEPFRWISLQIPIIKAIKNGRLILLASFGIATLAAMGLSTLETKHAQETETSARRRKAQLILVILFFAFSYFLVYELWETTLLRVEFIRRPSFSRALLFLSFLPIVLRLWGKFPRTLFPWAICGIAAFDLVTFSYGSAGFSDAREVFPKSPVFEFLRQKESPLQYRMAEVGGPYPDNTPMVYGLSSGDGYELAMQRMVDFAAGYSVPTDGLHFEGSTYFMQNDRRMDMLNVKYLVAMTNGPESVEFGKRADRYARIYNDSNISVYENSRVLPRFIAVPISGLEVVEPAQQLVRMKDPLFDPERTVLVSETPQGIPTQTHSSSLESKIAVLDAGVNGYTLQTNASEPAIVVVSQTRYVGWKATVDEKEAPVFTANYALSGFLIPAGTHNVRFVFQPWSLRIGIIVTGFSILIAVAMAARGKKQAVEPNLDAEHLQKQHFDSIAEQYSAHYGDTWSQRYRRQFMNDPMLGTIPLAGANTIEAMAGGGETTAYLLEKGARVTGVDISQEQMDIFHKRFPDCETRCTSMLSTGLREHSYDCVVVLGGLHHLHPNVDEAIQEIHRVLKTGGYFCFVEPHKGAFPDWIRQLWYKSDSLFAENEAAIDVDALKAQWASKFTFLKEEYKGNIAYLLVYNSLIFRIPLGLKPLYSPLLLKMESIIERIIQGKFLSCFVAAQWKKK